MFFSHSKNIEEKLGDFERRVLDQATRQRDAILDSVEARTQTALRRVRRELSVQMQRSGEKELEEIRREARSLVTNAQNESLTRQMQMRSDLREQVFAALLVRLQAFIQSADYAPYFTRKLEEAATVAAGHIRKNLPGHRPQVVVDLTRADADRFAVPVFEQCRAIFGDSDVHLVGDREELLGGCRIRLPQIGRLFDNSIASQVEREREGFLTWCGLS